MRPGWTLLGLALCGLAGVLAVFPWTVSGAVNRSDLAATMSRDLGLDVRVGGPVTLKLLPRPRVQIHDVSITAPDGRVSLSAPALSGELDIAALTHGQWRLISATLSKPTAIIDIDASSEASTGKGRDAADGTPFRLAVRSGVFRLVSKRLGTDTVVTDVSAVADKGDGVGAGLSVNGSALWRDMRGQFTLQLGVPTRVAEARQSDVFLQISSPAGSFSAIGDVSGGVQPQFAGRMSVSTAAPDRLFTALGLGPFWMNLQKVTLSGDAVAKIGDLSLSDAILRLNTSSFEGTLGYRTDNGHGLIEGTLATSRLDLDGLAGREIDRTMVGDFCGTQLAPHLAETNLDLRISASEVVIGNATLEEAALSLLARDSRLEVTLDEARAFGGIVKARFLGALLPGDIKAHAEMALSGVELGPLGAAFMGQERMAGTLTGKIAVDGHGGSLSAMVPTLAGQGQVTVENGHFIGMSVSQALKRFLRRLPVDADQPRQLTAFAAASSAMEIVDGTVNFIDGKVVGPGIAMTFSGHGDLPHGKVDIMAVASPTDPSGTLVAGAPGLPIEMQGTWGEPLMLMERNRHLPLPKLFLPDGDAAQSLP